MKSDTQPVHMVIADRDGQIYEHPELLLLCRRGSSWGLPRPDELIPLPKESEFFLLPDRIPCGLDPISGQSVPEEDALAVAAFLAPAHTLSAHPCYISKPNAPLLPLFAYAAVGMSNDQFYVCAKRVDEDERQCFAKISKNKIAKQARLLQKEYPRNRLISHILNNCVARYDCPAARNFALGRFEAPLPTSRTCPARCIGCISDQKEDSPIQQTPQCRLTFTPTEEEIVEVMTIHAKRAKEPIFSFGQGCEGDPLQEYELLCASIRSYRQKNGCGTINCNTNASNPKAVSALAQAGLTSLRVSLNSCQPNLYQAYYRPMGYDFADVLASIRTARAQNVFVSLNLLFFPGLTDTEEELEALAKVVGRNGVSMIQWRNLNIDPEWFYTTMTEQCGMPKTSGMGLRTFMRRLKKLCPWLRYGYFNPWLGEKASISAPLPESWSYPTLDLASN